MLLPDKIMVDFIRKHHVLTLATTSDGIPWCAHIFYTWLEGENWLVFTSSDETRHAREAAANAEVAGGIVLETSIIGKIQGVQLRGIMRRPAPGEQSRVKTAYLKRFPFAALMNTSLWILEINEMKMTDNRLGFGKKLTWERLAIAKDA